MAVETLGEALSCMARCAHGRRDGMRSIKECVYRAELDMETLVWTRGRSFPLSRLETRLRCPIRGSRDVRLIFPCREKRRRFVAQGRGRSESFTAWGNRRPADPLNPHVCR